MKRAWPIVFFALGACGEEAALTSTEGQSVLSVRLDARGAGAEASCGSSGSVDGLQAQAFPSDGSPAIRLDPDCSASVVDLSILPAGVYDVEVIALGYLRGLRNQVLYGGTKRVQVPGPARLVLAPEVAFVEVDWTPPDDRLPCEEGIDMYELRVFSETGAEPLMARSAGCTGDRFVFDDPIRPGSWTVVVEGLAGGQVRYARSEERILDAGLNALSLSLRPTGAQLAVDWSFGGPDGTSRGCDIAGVDHVDIEVRWADRTEDFIVPCAAERPRALEGLHLPLGAQVEIGARGDGVALYRGSASFSVEAQGKVEQLLLLEPFGRVDLSWALSEPCADVAFLELRIEDLVRETAFTVDVEPNAGGYLSPELPFSAYRFLLGAPERPECRVGGTFTIDSAYSELPELVLPNPL